jgi:outer membrane protein assembly factor BamD
MSLRYRTARAKSIRSWFAFAGLSFSIALLSGCALIHNPNRNAGLPVAPTEQPDKVLLTKALNEFQHGRYDTGRLLLQSMINTYPDSEYLSQAKLAIANSYFKQGGISGLTEAEAEYKDFITFFPTAPEAPMAEYRAAMCHFRLMGKADRDPSEALQAQHEFKEFLLKYPGDPLMPEVKDRLREVQEVLAEGEYEIAMFYYSQEANKAASMRFKEIVAKYPNFSEGDHVFWYLGQTLDRLHQPRLAIPYYDRLVMEFPLSPLVKNAKEQLASLHAPIPTPTEAMLARARADAAREDHRTMVERAFGGLSSSPDLSKTLHGPVVLGSPNQIQLQVARLNAPKKSAGKNALTAQTIPASVSGHQSADPAAANSAGHGSPVSKSQPSLTNGKQGASTTQAAVPAKHDSKFHFLKKVIPF